MSAKCVGVLGDATVGLWCRRRRICLLGFCGACRRRIGCCLLGCACCLGLLRSICILCLPGFVGLLNWCTGRRRLSLLLCWSWDSFAQPPGVPIVTRNSVLPLPFCLGLLWLQLGLALDHFLGLGNLPRIACRLLLCFASLGLCLGSCCFGSCCFGSYCLFLGWWLSQDPSLLGVLRS